MPVGRLFPFQVVHEACRIDQHFETMLRGERLIFCRCLLVIKWSNESVLGRLKALVIILNFAFTF